MDNTRLSNLLFLSGLATVGLPGCDLGDDESDTAASASASATASDGGGTGGDDTDGGSASASASATDTTDPSTSGDPTAGSDVCTQYATWVSECDASYDYAMALSDCNELVSYLTMESPACGAAYEELLACATSLDCATIEQDDVPAECQAQSDAYEAACDFGGGSSGGSDGTGG